MDLRNAILWHLLLILAQPTYFALKWTLKPGSFSSSSPVWLMTCLLSWIYILRRITIPFFKLPFRHLPTPTGDVFPLGHALLRGERQPPEPLTKACNATANDGIVAVWGFFYLKTRLVLTTPDAALEVVNTRNYDWEKPAAAKKILHRVLGDGLVNVEGNIHKAMRRSVAPAFSGRQIRDLVPLFWSKGLDYAQVLSRAARGSLTGEVEIMSQMSRVTLDLIGSAGIGMDFNTIHGDDNRLAKLYAAITSTDRGPLIAFVLVQIFLPPWLVRKLRGTVYARVANATAELRESVRELLAEKKQNLKQNGTEQKDIIATIMKSGDFSDDYLCDQLLTFFAAGHDTTASALTWTTMFLARYPHIQDRLRAECQTYLSNVPEDEVTADLFDHMPYLTAVCNETLRLYPTVTMTARHAVVDTKIGHIHVPRGSECIIPIWLINRDKSIWGPDATEFNPDRWLTGSSASTGGTTNPYAFFTFLYGPRSCIGQNFSRTEMKCLLAAIVLKVGFAPPADGKEPEIGGFVTMKPKNGLNLKVYDV